MIFKSLERPDEKSWILDSAILNSLIDLSMFEKLSKFKFENPRPLEVKSTPCVVKEEAPFKEKSVFKEPPFSKFVPCIVASSIMRYGPYANDFTV